MRSKLLHSFMLVMSIFLFVFTLASCDDTTNNNTSNTDTSINSTTEVETNNTTTNESTKQYKITFVDEDNKVLKEDLYDDGTKASDISKPEDPVKDADNTYTYEFAGWDKEIADVTKDATYKATYSKAYINYKVSFYQTSVLGNKLISSKDDYHYGDIVVVPEAPTKTSTKDTVYTFNGWDKKVTTVTGNAAYYATFSSSTRQYTVTFVDEDGTELSKNSYDYGTESNYINVPTGMTKEATAEYTYEFDGWDKVVGGVVEDVVYIATYKAIKNQYTVTFVDEDGTTILKEATAYDYGTKAEDIALPKNPTKNMNVEYHYVFDGWDKEIANVTEDVVYKATYKSIKNIYGVTFIDDENKQILMQADYEYGTKVEDIEIPDTTKAADNTYTYEFIGWNQQIVDVTSNRVYRAKYKKTYIDYVLTLTTNIDNAATLIGSGTYHYDDKVTVDLKTNDGYTFGGWFVGENPLSDAESFEYTIKSSITLEAKFIAIPNTLTIDNQSGLAISGVTSGTEYAAGTEITIEATNTTGKYLIWYFNDIVTNVGDSYTFNMPNKKLEIKLVLSDTLNGILYIRDSNKIYFGTYPQTIVEATDENHLKEISFDEESWISYKYYINSEQSDFMYYKDIDIDNNGTLDYRGVYFAQYRPNRYYSNPVKANSYQDDLGYSTNEIYWFKYELIEWDILDESDGKALIIANLILDTREFYISESTEEFEHNGGVGYANNYELSYIRKFLNEDFYNNVFDDLQKELIEKTIVDNNAYTTASDTNPYACNNTEDKLFLLSFEEVKTYYSDKTARQAKGTDYANCQGLWVLNGTDKNGCWLLRSPDIDISGHAYIINYSGYYTSEFVYHTNFGIRPACWINLK